MARILIVEDEEALALVLTHSLSKAGHAAIVAPDGETALREAGTRPDLILLDLGLPDLPGDEVLRRLKRRTDTAPIPVVIVSAQPDAATLVAKSGARAVAAILRKPVALPELCDVVASVLHAPGEWDEGAAPGVQEQRVGLLYRLFTEGSNALVRKACQRLDADRRRRHGLPTVHAPSWSDLARAARQEGLLSDAEGTLLVASPSLPVGAQ